MSTPPTAPLLHSVFRRRNVRAIIVNKFAQARDYFRARNVYAPPEHFRREDICKVPTAAMTSAAMSAEKNIDRGGYWRGFAGIYTQRKPSDIWTIDVFLTEERPDLIIEFGTGTGGFTEFLALFAFNTGGRLITIDIHKKTEATKARVPRALRAVSRLGGKYWNRDLYSAQTKAMVGAEIAKSKKVFLYCDGGNKALEIQMYADLLRPGDGVAVHDFGSEIHPADVAALLDTGKLESWNPHLAESSNSSNRFYKAIR